MSKDYTISELYLHLKLNIWRSGHVSRWGYVKKTEVNSDHSTGYGFYTPKAQESYTSFSPAQQLGVGLYLLDLCLMKRDVWNKQLTYLAIIAVCRTTMAQIQTIHCLEIVNSIELEALRKLITDNPAQSSMRKRKSPFRVGKTPRKFDASPIHSVRRKH